MQAAPRIDILDVTDETSFGRIPPCADPGFDHRSCDYWEDPDRGSRAARLDWLQPSAPSALAASAATPRRTPANPFLAELDERATNPFALPGLELAGGRVNPFAEDGDDLDENPFAPRRPRGPAVPATSPRKLRLLARGLGVAGSYAKVLLVDDEAAVYCQFGPLTAYPRAQGTRDLYPALPSAPLPAVITCIATTAAARGQGLARRLVEAVCNDLAGRGFAAVEAYPEVGVREDATSSATPSFWEGLGFVVAAADARFPVMRREFS